MLDVIADTWRAPTDEPGVKCGARVVVAPFFLRGDETHPQRQEIGIGRVWRPACERNVVAARAPLDVVPEIIHLHVVLRERGIVLLDQNFAQIERLPAHLDAGRGSKRADAHDRQVGVDAAVEEIEIEMTRHGSPSCPARTSRIHSLAWRGGTGATGRVPVTIDGWPLGAGILAQCCDGNEAW